MESSFRLPDKKLCGTTDSLLVYERNLKQWLIVSYAQYMANAVSFVAWSYLPKTPEVGLRTSFNDDDVEFLVRLAPQILVSDEPSVRMADMHLSQFEAKAKEGILRQFKKARGGFDLAYALEMITTKPGKKR